MRDPRCAARCGGHGHSGVTRRDLLLTAAATTLSAPVFGSALSGSTGKVVQHGPASRCVPKVRACFVRREGEYGLRWPGQVYDGEAARKKYIELIRATAAELNLQVDLMEKPLFTPEEATNWVASAASAKPDGLFVVLLDRQEHAWPTATKAIDTGIPTVVFSPVGTSFTTNTAPLARKPNNFIAATDDFAQARYGLKMLQAGARMRATRCLVIAGDKAATRKMPHLDIELNYLPARTFLEEYEKTPVNDEVRSLAAELIKGARKLIDATEQDVINGIKSYVVARTLLEREEADAITMDCLGALGPSKDSLPCIAWSKMNDDGIPAACEADLGAVATHTIVQYLFDRPGFQQDPVPETTHDAIIGAHCSCPTRLSGFAAAPEPYDIVHHHGLRDATARPVWKVGQRVTLADVLPGNDKTPTQMVIAAGTVLENLAVPPSGGCVISVMVKFDGSTDVLEFPGFHQLFFHGDFKKELTQFCKLQNIEPVLA